MAMRRQKNRVVRNMRYGSTVRYKHMTILQYVYLGCHGQEFLVRRKEKVAVVEGLNKQAHQFFAVVFFRSNNSSRSQLSWNVCPCTFTPLLTKTTLGVLLYTRSGVEDAEQSNHKLQPEQNDSWVRSCNVDLLFLSSVSGAEFASPSWRESGRGEDPKMTTAKYCCSHSSSLLFSEHGKKKN